MFDRSPQLELYADCLRAKQLGDVEICWSDVYRIRTLDKTGTAQDIGWNTNNHLLVLDVAGAGEITLNLDGLGVLATEVLDLIEGIRREFKRKK